MKTAPGSPAFALAVTLVLMALIVLVVVAYLGNSQTDRASASIYSDRSRAKMMAESGLAAATKLLANNSRYGNYITAMPPPSPSPAPLYTEIYRPTDPTDTTGAKADAYLQLTDASGEILVSLAGPTPFGAPPQVDPRPTPAMIPPAGPFAMANPGLTSNNSYDFNQIVRLGTNASGRLVNPLPTPAYGQWVRVRNSNNELVGRYAFFVEDESMKANVNATGNHIGGSNLRLNDLILPLPNPAPSTQLQEVDPAAILATTADRIAANVSLNAVGSAGSRLPSRSTLSLLDPWGLNFSEHAHLTTVMSRDDDTTARGWQRMDLNSLVASTTDNASKVAAARRIADWIRDAWTGPPLAGLASYQLFNDSRLRLQIAANIVDYVDADSVPTDMGDIFPDGYPDAIPVIGIEKMPYLVAVEIIYQASNSDGASSAELKMKIQFRFLNLYESDLDLTASVGRIELQGVPVVQKNGATVFDVSTVNYVIPIGSLTSVIGSASIVPAGSDGASDSGAKTFSTAWLEDQTVSFFGSSKPILLPGKIIVRVYGLNGERLDDTAIVTNQVTTGYQAPSSGNISVGDFLNDATVANGARQTGSISLIYSVPPGITTALNFGDPRVRKPLVSDRWYNISRSDASLPVGSNRIDAFVDKAEFLNRTFAFDWYDYTGNRPLAFVRNGALRSVGELGNIVACEYPWRTIYLQYPERVANTTQTGPVSDIPQRRNASVDYILTDLFRTQTTQPRIGATNINTQQRVGTQQHPLAPLFFAELIGNQPSITQTMLDRLCDSTGSGTISPIFARRNAVGPPVDNSPLHPFFQIGELASVLSRLVNSTTNTTTGVPARSTVTYSVLRNSPSTQSEINPNYRTDNLAEQEFREISDSITVRGNVFRVLYVGQSIKDMDADGMVTSNEIQSEFLGEAFVEREAAFVAQGTNPDAMKTGGSSYKIRADRAIIE